MNIYVFTGPTLSAQQGRSVLDAVYQPPASQGDVYRATLNRPDAIGIIDGFFDHVPAVWHKEILWAISQGIPVYGSGSMGALRAAELARFGMKGVGQIFEAYRDGSLEDDDEVAVAHASGEQDFRPVSEALVNIRATLERAQKEGIVGAATRRGLEDIAKRLYYPHRSYPVLLEQGAGRRLPATELESLRDWLPQGRVDQKREDALAMLATMGEEVSCWGAPQQASFAFERTVYWERLVRSACAGAPASDMSDAHALLETLLEEIRLDPETYFRLGEGALLRHLLLEEAPRLGVLVSEQDLKSVADGFRRRLGLMEPGEFQHWLEESAMTAAQFAAFIREEATIALARPLLKPSASQRLLHELRASGKYRHFLDRAAEKKRLLEAKGMPDPALQDLGLTPEALIAWYFQQLPASTRSQVETYLEISRFADENPGTFLRSLAREYLYLQLTKPERAEASTEVGQG